MIDIAKIKAPEEKKRPGRPYTNKLRKWAAPTKMDALAALYEKIVERKRKCEGQKIYGEKEKIVEAIAEKYRANPDSLLNHINRTKKIRTTRKKSKL